MTKKNWIRGLFLGFLLLASPSYAKRAPDPVISLTEVFEDTLAGEINTYIDYGTDYTRWFFLVNPQGQIAWQGVDNNPEGAVSAFSFPVPVNGGLYDLQVLWLDKYFQKRGSANLVIENIKPETYDLFTVATRSSLGQLEVIGEWKSTSDSEVQLVVEVRENSYWGPLLFEKKSGPASSRTGSSFVAELSVDIPQNSENYLVLAKLVDTSGGDLTPTYQGRLVVPGEFAEIFAAYPVSGSDLGSSSSFVLSGKGSAPLGEGYVLRLSELEGSWSEDVVLSERDLSGIFSFEKEISLAPSEKSEIQIQAQVIGPSANILDQKVYTYKKVPVVPVVEEVVPVPEFRIPLWAYGIGGFGILLLIGGLFFMHKKK